MNKPVFFFPSLAYFLSVRRSLNFSFPFVMSCCRGNIIAYQSARAWAHCIAFTPHIQCRFQMIVVQLLKTRTKTQWADHNPKQKHATAAKRANATGAQWGKTCNRCLVQETIHRCQSRENMQQVLGAGKQTAVPGAEKHATKCQARENI